MTLILGYNQSENNRVTKTVTTLQTLSGTLREESSIIDPSILVEGVNNETLSKCNYAEIPEFGRKYFVQNIESVRNNLWRFSMHVDVLSTYQEQIRAQTAVIRRQENIWNLYLDDGIFKTYQNPYIFTKAFPSGFTTQQFILAVAGS